MGYVVATLGIDPQDSNTIYYQVNFRVPVGIAPGTAVPVPVRLTYIGRASNEVTIGVQ
jgi:hypothetical protein